MTIDEIKSKQADLRKEAEALGKTDFGAAVAKWNEAEALTKEIEKQTKANEAAAFEATKAERLAASEAAHDYAKGAVAGNGAFKAAMAYGLASVRVTPAAEGVEGGPVVTYSFKVPDAIVAALKANAATIFGNKAVQGAIPFKMRHLDFEVNDTGIAVSVGFAAPKSGRGPSKGSGGGRLTFMVNGAEVKGHRGLAGLAGKLSEFDDMNSNGRYKMGKELEVQLHATKVA